MDSFGIPALETDARNWTIWRGIVEEVINDHGLCHYLNGTATDPDPQLSALAKFIIVSSISDTLCWLLQTHINFPRFLPIFPDFLERLSHFSPYLLAPITRDHQMLKSPHSLDPLASWVTCVLLCAS
jgi:hypothetical protein